MYDSACASCKIVRVVHARIRGVGQQAGSKLQ